jgi:uncharacterized protein (TIGR00369 family)
MPPLLSHTEKVQLVEALCRQIPHTGLQGIRVEAVAGDELTLRLPYREELVGNPDTGVVHAGALTVVLDQAMGICGVCSDRLGPWLTPTLDLRIDHLRLPPAGCDILAAARVYHATRRIVFVEGLAYCESRDEPVARATGSWVLMPEVGIDAILAAPLAGACP